MSEHLTLTEAAQRAGVSRSTIRRKHEDKKFPHAAIVRGQWRIPIEDLEASGVMRRAYAMSPLVAHPGEAVAEVVEHEERAPFAGSLSVVEEMGRLREALSAALHRAELAEAIATERGMALERHDRAMLMLEAAPKPPAAIEARPVGEPWWRRLRTQQTAPQPSGMK
jgi:excisionase family DNA binding protein